MNGARARASTTLRRHDLVQVTIPDPAAPRQLAPYDRPLVVVHEDDFLLVLDKPAGLVVHPAPGHWDDTLLNALVARDTPLSSAIGRPGIVHRLDKDTSGLLVVAKMDAAHRWLANELGRRHVRRVYAALVWGHVEGALDVVAPVARHPKDRKRMAVLAGGRPARTRVERVARFQTCDLVRVTLDTGRTHQIRVHLAHVGHPVVGDPVYGGGGARRVTGSQRRQAEAVERAAPRQALHAAELAFRHPETRAEVIFRSDWPGDLREVLAAAAEDATLLARSPVLEYLGFRK